MADIKDTLKQNVEGLLSEDALNEIESAFNAAVEERSALHVESALVKQDEEHASKVQSLLTAIDDDHTKKLGRNQINEATEQLTQVKAENETLKVQLDGAQATEVLDRLSADLPDYKKKYVQKVLNDKSAQFISENFDYTLALFDKESTKKNEVLKEEAQQTVKGGNVDPVVAQDVVVEESATDIESDPGFSNYMNELGKY